MEEKLKRMTKETKNFIIYYNNCDKRYLNVIIDNLENSLEDYLSFFNLKGIKEKIILKLFNNIDEFKVNYEKIKNHQYKATTVGFANNNCLNILSYNERIKIRPQDTFEIFIMGIKHELVHICHIIYKGNNNGNWFAKGLATNLGSPRYEIDVSCSLEELLTKSKYKYCYTVTKYMLGNYSHNKILEYSKNDEMLIKDSKKILDEAKIYFK